ncbi:MAG: hypothetical protein PHU31_01710, partial [Anaerotignum sp.]|nr:hypothetical protein [Anaerotignum sp.]
SASDNNSAQLMIYHINDDELELHFTAEYIPELSAVSSGEKSMALNFLAPTGENYWDPACMLNITGYNGGMTVDFNAVTKDIALTSRYDEIPYSIDGNTLICTLKASQIIRAFDHVELLDISAQDFGVNGSELLPFEDMITDDLTKISKPPVTLPDVFPVHERDGEYFAPTSDSFILVMVEYPEVSFLDYALGSSYAPVGTRLSPVTVLYLSSFAENGDVAQSKYKIIYSNTLDTMTAAAQSHYDILNGNLLTGDDTHDSPIIADFFEQLDQKTFQSDINHEYYGLYDNVRYFSGYYTPLDIEYPHYDFSSYDANELKKDTYAYQYAVNDPNTGDIENKQATANVTVFYSKN